MGTWCYFRFLFWGYKGYARYKVVLVVWILTSKTHTWTCSSGLGATPFLERVWSFFSWSNRSLGQTDNNRKPLLLEPVLFGFLGRFQRTERTPLVWSWYLFEGTHFRAKDHQQHPPVVA